MIPGIDVSHYQGQIDWVKVAQSGVKFAYINATEGAVSRDLRFTSNWAKARKAGLIVGPYHYMKAATPASLAAGWLFAFLNAVDRSGSLPLAIDIEDQRITLAEVQALLKELSDHWNTPKPILYLDRWMAVELNIPSADLPLWFADYDKNVTIVTPRPWTQYTFWQYQWGRVPGISTPVDLDWFNGSPDDLKALCLP